MTAHLWTSTGYGRRVGLRVPHREERRVRELLPFWWADTDVTPERMWDVGSADDAERTVRDLELWVAEHAVGRVFVHAGVVVLDGRALLLPGRSMAGKTTLTAALLRAGAQYASDEYAVLDETGRVHPYPRPLTVRTTSGRARVPAGEFGAVTATAPAPVGVIAVVRHVAEAAWQPAALSPADAVLRLLDNTVSARTQSAAALDAVSRAAAGAVAIEGLRDDPAPVVARLLELLAPGVATA